MAMIIKQPDGQLAVISYSVIVLWNATESEVIDWFVARAREEAARAIEAAEHRTQDNLRKVVSGRASQAYGQFAMTWEEALRSDRRHDGEAHREFPTLPPDPCPECGGVVITNGDGSMDCLTDGCDYHLIART